MDECLADYTTERRDELLQWKESLQEQLQKVTTLSDQNLALVEADDELTDEDLSTELMNTNTLNFDVKLRLSAIEKTLTANVPPSLPSPSVEFQANKVPFNPWPAPQLLPFDEIAETRGRHVWRNIREWQEFWDSFESAIVKNETLAEIDKFLGPSDRASAVGDRGICPHIGKLQSCDRTSKETLRQTASYSENVHE